MNSFFSPLRNERGAGVLALGAIVSVLILAGTGAMFMLSRQVSNEGSRALSGYQGDESIRNALIFTKSLITAGCLVESGGAWTVGAGCTANREWALGKSFEGKPVVELSLCTARAGEFIKEDGTLPDETGCVKQAVKVTLLEMVDKDRRKVVVTTKSGRFQRVSTALLGKGDGEEPPDPPPPPCVPGLVSELVDFENFDAGTGMDAANAKLQTDYGVSFESLQGGQLLVAPIVGQGESEPSIKAWMSILCPRRPNFNRLCFEPQPEAEVVRANKRILTTTGATNSKVISFRVRYSSPVSSLSFDIADVDGGEVWTVQALNSAGQVLTGTRLSSQGYGGGQSGNSALTGYSVVRDNPDISSVVITGTKNIKIFGFGFDNFKTGNKICPAK